MYVGVRELHDRLSHYLREVRAGQTIIITHRGTPMARLKPVDQPDVLERLVAEGKVQRPGVDRVME